MKVYLLVACDRLEENEETKLKKHLPDLQAALQKYADDNATNNVTLINQCDSDSCEDWELGVIQAVKKSIHLKFPVNLFNDLAKDFGIDCEIGSIEDDSREPVSYFGKHEGKGDSFLIAQYLGL
ncbi:hypothetical protein [Pseudomaricurvus sp.]|uniref:hypothetical protein n=1 Tax=Pseudomaricurvus sp. TaxID=2004510 RepID=UPI003F6C2746